MGRYLSLTSNLSAKGMLSVFVWIWIVWIWTPLLLVENSSENSRCCAAWFGPIGACIFLIRSSLPPVFLPLTKIEIIPGLHELMQTVGKSEFGNLRQANSKISSYLRMSWYISFFWFHIMSKKSSADIPMTTFKYSPYISSTSGAKDQNSFIDSQKLGNLLAM